MADTTAHLFQNRPSAARRWEKGILAVFGAATYFIMACGAAILLTIMVRGAPTVFRAQAPFVNGPFLTQAPETLFVFEFEGKHYELGDRAFRAYLGAARP